ncbi:uncharacterized protein [Parasteatoda tepidariorum]|uniref:uncharacterized protein n=1 Tax=Parasteatoda tepidariorum TaxID=114398 RepID=UPI00077F98E2|nr:uncharacterized protein LOC107454128 [Parasteatoda tepidariorum]
MRGLLLIVGITIALPSMALSAAINCHTSEIMKCVDLGVDWFISLPKRSIPVTVTDVDNMCDNLEKAFECAHKYLDTCLTPMQKEVVDLAVEGVEEFRYQFCSKGSPQRSRYEAHSECLNQVAQLDEVKDHIEYFLAVLENINSIENEKKLMYGCCGYAKGYNIMQDLVKSKCGEETAQADRELLGMIFAQLPDVLCNGFTGNEDRCKAVLPPDGTKPTNALKGTALYDYVRHALQKWID